MPDGVIHLLSSREMGLYSRYVFPWLLDRALSCPAAAAQRPVVLAQAFGDVLEIGFGTGLNLPHGGAAPRGGVVGPGPWGALRKWGWGRALTPPPPPPPVGRRGVAAPTPGPPRRASRRIAASPVPIEYLPLREGREIGVADES